MVAFHHIVFNMAQVVIAVAPVPAAAANARVSDLPPLASEVVAKLQKHNWRRGIWYAGK